MALDVFQSFANRSPEGIAIRLRTPNDDHSPEISSQPAEATAGSSAGAVMEPMDIENPEAGSPSQSNTPPVVYITGWRLYLLTFALCLSLLLSTLETTIVSTSLVSITDALGGFDQRDWIVTAYLLTYTGFLIIYAKFSDILGRKSMLLLAIALFTIFSIVCGSVSNILQLIIFRAFQGMGASGIYSMVTVINPEMVPPTQWGKYVAITSMVFILSSVLGPILGGAINDHGSWRWVFLLNAPAGVIATALIAFVLPTRFPYQGNPAMAMRFRDKFSAISLSRLDVIGALILLAASILVVFGFEEAGARYPWSSPAVIVTLALGGALFVIFVGWERLVGREHVVQEPIFPLRLMKSRFFVGMFLVGFFTGPPFMTVIINLPQRFQAVNGLSPFDAGIHLLPLLLCSPFATAICGSLASKLNVPPFYILITGASLQLLGVGLASSVGINGDKQMYGYEVIMGFSFGTVLVTLLMFVPLVIPREDMAVAMGAITQIRVLGGTIGLAIRAPLNVAITVRKTRNF
ncbi:putative mfs multidrug transporter protein [Phaeoacremonium minimum UCRPA7]|uniref:Putative mfs multidrug transporter protein n=1 Tax=Phaeoacremonium minimum (strain UCR-PA7) TaxID=1286976 RepID=R8BDW0_PHAM7|nr:putative mfs multidrug transporter protein [Phaeoacremonium minimum UCRPA7]EON97493.1 putative mfs multidrug transporter protein [Phaeoacremonium minimum UCRPA7]